MALGHQTEAESYFLQAAFTKRLAQQLTRAECLERLQGVSRKLTAIVEPDVTDSGVLKLFRGVRGARRLGRQPALAEKSMAKSSEAFGWHEKRSHASPWRGCQERDVLFRHCFKT